MYKIKYWIKQPENIGYLLLILVCVIIVGIDNFWSLAITLLIAAVFGFLIRKLFF